MLGLRRAVGTEVVHWLGANKPAYKLDEKPREADCFLKGLAINVGHDGEMPHFEPRPPRALREYLFA
jgi:hypothetical protein